MSSTFHHAGTLGDDAGELSFGFMPEYSAIFLFASVPSDKRRVPISIRLSDTGELREILNKLESLIEAEAERRRLSKQPEGAVMEGGEFTSVLVSGSSISIPRPLYDEVAGLVAGGKSVVAAGLLSKSITWLGISGARELVQVIYESQRASGARE